MKYIILETIFLLSILQVNRTWGKTHQSHEIKLLILDGFSNHHWQRTTILIKQILQQDGGINIEVSTSPNGSSTKEELENCNPDFSSYDVVLLNCNDLGDSVRCSDNTRRNLDKTINIELQQVQPEKYIFNMPLEIGIQASGKNTEQIKVINLDKRKIKISIPSETMPKDVVLDPGTKILAQWDFSRSN